MKTSEIIEAIKEFFLDLLGYFLPGLITLILLFICIKTDLFLNHINSCLDEWAGWLILCLSYVSGYIIYSLADIRDGLLKPFFINAQITNRVGDSNIDRGWKKTILKIKGFITLLLIYFGIEVRAKVEEDIKTNVQYKMCLELIKKTWNKDTIIKEIDYENISMRELRSIIMSYIPEADTKIYTFMFRAELCNHISASFLFIGFLAITQVLLDKFFNIDLGIFLTNREAIILYLALLIMSYLLYLTRIRFLRIAYKIPFTIFISRNYKLY